MSTEGRPRIEVIHTAKNDPSYNLPYAPAIVVNGGRLLFTAAMAAPTYHHHPHRPEEFDDLPEDTGGAGPADHGPPNHRSRFRNSSQKAVSSQV